MSDDAEEQLRELSARIERLSLSPSEVRRQRPWLRVAKPFFQLFRWRPQIKTAALRSLLALLRDAEANAAAASAPLPEALSAALAELSANVTATERAAVVEGTAQGSRVGWLTRLHEVTSRAAQAARSPDDASKRTVALALDAEWVLTPLTLQAAAEGDGGAHAQGQPGEPTPSAAVDAADPASGDGPGPILAGEEDPAVAARLIEVELAAIDRVLDAAGAETHFLGRRRRLFEAARKLLLDASAAAPLEPTAVQARAQHIADQIVLANRWEAAGVAPDVALPHQAVSALARGDRQKLYATLRASHAMASGVGNVDVVARAGEALRRLDGAAGESSGDASIARSSTELLGEAAVAAVESAYAAARKDLAFRKSAPRGQGEDADEEEQRISLWDRYLHGDAMLATLSAAVSVDGCFEVGGTLAPVRAFEESHRVRIVSYPTPDLVLVPSRDVQDLPSAIIDDPRSVMLALAAGRLLSRKFRRVETVRTARTRLVSEVRVYVLDGSDSMLLGGSGRKAGARARMRDAILLAELATLYRRASERGQAVRVVLFYRYFSKRLGEVVRVDSAADALRAMADVVGTPRHGGTDIEAALLASFEQIREARATDPELSRAQIVLVTDGDAPVDEAAVRAARERAGDLRIGVSVIALGEENPILRRLVARQRARGEAAFYHFVPDTDLTTIAEGRRPAGAPVHSAAAPTVLTALTVSERAAELAAELGTLVDEMDALDRARRDGVAAADAMGTANAGSLAAVGVSASETEGERARREVRARDEHALSRRFDAWFPDEFASVPPPSPLLDVPEGEGAGDSGTLGSDGDRPPNAAAEADAEAALVVLATLADVLADLGGTASERRADAIELLERLLPDAQLSPARYRAVVRARPASIAGALAALRAAVTPPSRAA